MAETVNTLLRDVFEDMVVSVAESSLKSDDVQTGIRAINRVMNAFSAQGINLGHTEVANLKDPITMNAGAIDSLISILAVRLWPKYRSGTPTQSLYDAAKAGIKQIELLGVKIQASEYPSTLPTGTGNDYKENGTVFYPDLESTILLEDNGSIALEDSTNE